MATGHENITERKTTMTRTTLLLALLLGTACGDNEPPLEPGPVTWGEATAEVAKAICRELSECAGTGGIASGPCIFEIQNYMCGYDNTCSTVVDPDVLLAVAECTEAIPEEFCPNLELGLLPAECAEYFEYQPPEVVVPTNGGNGDGQGSRGRGKGRR